MAAAVKARSTDAADSGRENTVSEYISFTKVFISPKRTQSYSGGKNKTKTPLGRQHLKQVVKFP